MVVYTEKEIRAADAALCAMMGSEKLLSVHDVRSAMSVHGSPYKMVEVLKSDLRLIICRGDSWTLTLEGQKAAQMGFARYLRYLRMKESIATWGPVASVIAAIVSIIGAIVSWII